MAPVTTPGGGRRWRPFNYANAWRLGRRTGGSGATIVKTLYRGLSPWPVFFWHAWTTRLWSRVFQTTDLKAAKRSAERWLDRNGGKTRR